MKKFYTLCSWCLQRLDAGTWQCKRRNADAGFALSDHADWDGLLQSM